MKLYVWEGILSDYTDGIGFAMAESEDEARALLKADIGACGSAVDGPPTWVSETPKAGHVWGGG